MTTLHITLPENLAREASRMGLLEPEALRALLRAAVRERRIQRMFAAMDALAQANLPVFSIEDIRGSGSRAAGH